METNIFEVVYTPAGKSLCILGLVVERTSWILSVTVPPRGTTSSVSRIVAYDIVHRCIGQRQSTCRIPCRDRESGRRRISCHLGTLCNLAGEFHWTSGRCSSSRRALHSGSQRHEDRSLPSYSQCRAASPQTPSTHRRSNCPVLVSMLPSRTAWARDWALKYLPSPSEV